MFEFEKRATQHPGDSQLQASLAARLSTDEKRCSGVDENDIHNNGWRYLYQAAAAGNATAMTQFVIDPGLDRDNPAFSAEGWLLYRDHAQEFISRAITAGDVGAAYVGAFDIGFGLSIGGKDAFRIDPYVALVYANAILPYPDSQRVETMQHLSGRLEAQLPPDRVLLAQQDATALSARMAAAGAAQVTWPGGDDAHVDPATDCSR